MARLNAMQKMRQLLYKETCPVDHLSVGQGAAAWVWM